MAPFVHVDVQSAPPPVLLHSRGGSGLIQPAQSPGVVGFAPMAPPASSDDIDEDPPEGPAVAVAMAMGWPLLPLSVAAGAPFDARRGRGLRLESPRCAAAGSGVVGSSSSDPTPFAQDGLASAKAPTVIASKPMARLARRIRGPRAAKGAARARSPESTQGVRPRAGAERSVVASARSGRLGSGRLEGSSPSRIEESDRGRPFSAGTQGHLSKSVQNVTL